MRRPRTPLDLKSESLYSGRSSSVSLAFFIDLLFATRRGTRVDDANYGTEPRVRHDQQTARRRVSHCYSITSSVRREWRLPYCIKYDTLRA